MANPPFYPAIERHASVTLTVNAPQELHWEECRDLEGIPVVFIHGGPGARCSTFDNDLPSVPN